MADGLDFVPDVDMVDLSRCWLKPEDRSLWDATEDIAETMSNCGAHGMIQSFITARGGPPTEKEIEDYREEKLAEERKQWDADFRYSEPRTAVDRLLAKDKK